MKKIGMVQINNGFSGQYYLPYSVGLLQAYVQKYILDKNKYTFELPIYRRLPLERNLELLNDVEIIFFSVYVWNEKISIEIARKIKESNPDVYIIFGGPSVPDNAIEFMCKYTWIDVSVHQEGEISTLEILERYPDKDLTNVSGITYRVDNQVFTTGPRKRMKNFSDVPSPYLTGVFDDLMKSVGSVHQWLATWESNRGCPFACAYCDWGSATNSKVSKTELDRALLEIDWFAMNKVEFIFIADANFGIFHRDEEIVDYVINVSKRTGYPKVFSVQNTKNKKERAYIIQKKLAESGLTKAVTLALQTTSEKSLSAISRDNIRSDDYLYLQNRFIKDGISTYTELILALPGETYSSFANGVSNVISGGQHNKIQFNNLSILPNAEMASNEYIKKYNIKTVKAPIVNMHGTLEVPEDGINEEQELVVSTSTLRVEDWRRVREYASYAELLYFCKLLQIPMLFLSVECGISYRVIIEMIMGAPSSFLVLSKISRIFKDNTKDILNGGAEFIFSEKWEGIFWPPGEYAFIELSTNQLLKDFYKECSALLEDLLDNEGNKKILADSILYNYKKLNQPNPDREIIIELDYPINKWYKEWIIGNKCVLKHERQSVILYTEEDKYDSWNDWVKYMVWYGHRTGAYYFNDERMESEISGHY